MIASDDITLYDDVRLWKERSKEQAERRAKSRDGRLEVQELRFRGPVWEAERLPSILSSCIR